MEKLINYEAHVYDFTAECIFIPEYIRGKFLAICHPYIIKHLKKMGVNCLQLMPIFEKDNTHWGYGQKSYMDLNKDFATVKGQAETELKLMVETLHSHGIKVVLDIVLNHSAAPVDGIVYGDVGFSGCGGDVRVDKSMPAIKASIDKWMSIVDGLRFDLAPVLFRENNQFNPDGVFAQYLKTHYENGKIIIVEPWDCGGYSGYESYFVGQFPYWCIEINDKINHAVRQGGTFYCGDDYKKNIGYICSHDGFVFEDLVSYNCKHNERNGENNKDGNNNNNSNNHGCEGITNNQWIIDARIKTKKQMVKNLKISSYHIMILSGDEMCKTQEGCNNDYLIGTSLKWSELENNKVWFDWYCNALKGE